MLVAGQSMTLDVTALTYGRDAVARCGDVVVFVAAGAPGDRVQARIREVHTSFARADIEQVLVAGPARVDPPCPLYAACGGCPWQHVDYPAQLVAKRAAVIDAFERIGGFAAPPVTAIIPSPKTLEYRNRIKLRFQDGKIGFYRARSHSLVPIADCMVAEPRLRAALPIVERFVASLATHVTRVELQSRGELPGVVVGVNSKGRLRRSDVGRVSEWLAERGQAVVGVVMWGRGWSRQWGDTRRAFTVCAHGPQLRLRAGGFGQINSDANRALVATVLEAASPGPETSALDLYAGAGNFSLPLAARCRSVLAVESDRAATESGSKAAREQGIDNLRFTRARVEDVLAAGDDTAADLIVLDPPRSGAAAASGAIAALRAPRVVYVACDPTTLARDARVFAGSGYRVESIVPIDLFPHTFHVETVCTFQLT